MPRLTYGALGDVGGDPCGELVAADAVVICPPPRLRSLTCRRRPSRSTPPTNSPPSSHARSPTATTRSTKMPGVTTASGSSAPERHDLVDLHDRRRRGRRHDRPEVARRLAVDEVAPAVRLQRADRARSRRGSGTPARTRGRRSSRASLPSASSVPTPVGEKNAPMPAPAARMRSARLPCGTSSSSISPGAVQAVEHPRVVLPRERADDLAHPPRREQRGEPGVAVAGVVVDDRQVARALLDERVDQLDRLPGSPEAADHHRRTVGDAGHRGGDIRHRLVDHGASPRPRRRPRRDAERRVRRRNARSRSPTAG